MEKTIHILSTVQRTVLTYLHEFIEHHGYAPKLTEIASHIGVKSLSTVHFHLTRLEKKNFIKRGKGGKITINDSFVVDKESERSVDVDEYSDSSGNFVPLSGVIVAGYPVEAIENTTMIEIPSYMTAGYREVFCLEVSGDSMIKKNICDGDIVVINKQEFADNGSIVVALLNDGSATLKTYKKLINGKVMLMPANDNLQPITLDSVAIQGKVIGLIRKFI